MNCRLQVDANNQPLSSRAATHRIDDFPSPINHTFQPLDLFVNQSCLLHQVQYCAVQDHLAMLFLLPDGNHIFLSMLLGYAAKKTSVQQHCPINSIVKPSSRIIPN